MEIKTWSDQFPPNPMIIVYLVTLAKTKFQGQNQSGQHFPDFVCERHLETYCEETKISVKDILMTFSRHNMKTFTEFEISLIS